jgi:hypothetical protein
VTFFTTCFFHLTLVSGLGIFPYNLQLIHVRHSPKVVLSNPSSLR